MPNILEINNETRTEAKAKTIHWQGWNAVVSEDFSTGTNCWISGTWHRGIWWHGIWISGNWRAGLWLKGDWLNGNWETGTIRVRMGGLTACDAEGAKISPKVYFKPKNTLSLNYARYN